MSKLPLFIEMTQRQVLLIGGGRIALRKAKILVEAGASLTVIAPEILAEFEALPKIKLINRTAQATDVNQDFSLVIIAGSDPDCNNLLTQRCRQLNILVSRCDDAEKGDFICSAPLKSDGIDIGIYCSGVPEMKKFVSQRIKAVLHGQMPALARIMSELRPLIKMKFPDESERRSFIARFICDESLQKLEIKGEKAFREEVLSCL